MPTYRIQGTAAENGTGAAHLIIAYKGDRSQPASMGEELGRTTASAGGSWEVQFDDWEHEVIVVCLDMDTAIKYEAKLQDWQLASLATDISLYKSFESFVTDDLVASHMWTMDEASGNFIDQIGTVDFTPAGGALTYESASIDADDKSVEFAASYTNNLALDTVGTEVTVGMLIKLDSANSQIVCGFGTVHNSNTTSVILRNSGADFGFTTYTGDCYGLGSAGSNVADGNWHTVIMTFAGTNLTTDAEIWLDGVEQSLSQLTGTTTARALVHNFSLGAAGNYTVSSLFEGGLSRVCVIDGALSPRQCRDLHTALLTGYVNSHVDFVDYLGLDSYWNMNNTLGTQFKSIIGPDGTLVNSPTKVAGPFPLGGSALQFNGSDQYIGDVGTTSDYSFIHDTGVFSISVWIKLDAPDTDTGPSVCGSTGSASDRGFWLAYENRSVTGSPHGMRIFIGRGVASSPLRDYTWDDSIPTGSTVWHHVCVTGDGSGCKLYVDGVDMGTADTIITNGFNTPGNATRVLNIARANFTSPFGYMDGAIDQLRIYDSELSASNVRKLYEEGVEKDPDFANVESLCNFDGADNATTTTDNIAGASWVIAGSADLTVADKRFGPTSITFRNATGDRAHLTGVSAFGTGDFCIEGWFKCINQTSVVGWLFDMRALGTLNSVGYIGAWVHYTDGFLNLQGIGGTPVITGTTNVKDSTWHHFAVSRVSGTTRMFLDGTQEGSSYADSNTYVAPVAPGITFGNRGYSTYNNPLDGYLDEWRVTTGSGRYSSNFTAPVFPFAKV